MSSSAQFFDRRSLPSKGKPIIPRSGPELEETSSKDKGAAIGTLAGGIIGIGIGLWLAPQAGAAAAAAAASNPLTAPAAPAASNVAMVSSFLTIVGGMAGLGNLIGGAIGTIAGSDDPTPARDDSSVFIPPFTVPGAGGAQTDPGYSGGGGGGADPGYSGGNAGSSGDSTPPTGDAGPNPGGSDDSGDAGTGNNDDDD